MKIIKNIFNHLGYTFSKTKKSIEINEIIKLNINYLKCDLLIDVGANRGDFSYEFIDKFNQIILIEPNPNLKKNLIERFKKFKNVKIFDCGIDKESSIKKLNITSDKDESLSSIKKQNTSISKNLRNTKVAAIKDINLTRLDNLLKENNITGKDIFIKTDTQGNELEVLESLGEFINNVKFIHCEMSILPLYEDTYDHWSLLKFFKKNNFNPIFFENSLRNNIGEMIEYNVLCKKKHDTI